MLCSQHTGTEPINQGIKNQLIELIWTALRCLGTLQSWTGQIPFSDFPALS